MPSGVVQLRRPRAIVFDILGTASKSGFLERILFPFLKINLENYINTHWDKSDFIKLYKRIEEQSIEFNRQEPATPVVAPHMAAQAKTSLLQFINFVTDNAVNSPAVTQLRFKVWFEGYQQSRLRTPIYSDVPNSLKRWYAEGLKFYVFSNTWVEAQKALLRNTNHGDLTNLIAGYFDNDFGLLTEVDSWHRFCKQIGQSPNNVIFLTKSPAEGRAAQDAGLSVVLVLTHRHNVKAVSHDDRQRFAYVRTLNDLAWTEGSMMPNAEPGASEMADGGATAPAYSGPVSLAPAATGATAVSPSMPLQASAATTHASGSTAAHSSQHSSSSVSRKRHRSTSGSNSKHASRNSSRATSGTGTSASSTATQNPDGSSSSHK